MRSGRLTQVQHQLERIVRRMGLNVIFIKFIMGISRLVFLILWLNHLGGCIWYMFVTNESEGSDTGKSWTTDITAENKLTDLPSSYWYLQGLYWSVTAMFSGASWRPPTNSAETLLSLAFVIFGMLFGSSLISSVAEMLLDFQLAQRDRSQKMSNLALFLRQHRIPLGLSHDIQDQVVSRMGMEQFVARKDVVVLNTLSTSFRQKLEMELYGPILGSISFLGTCDQLDDTFINDLATNAVAWKCLDAGDQLFEPCDDAETAHCVIGGTLAYTPKENLLSLVTETSSTQLTQLGSVDLSRGTWLCEVALWCHWLTCGRAESITPSELLTLNREDMAKVLGFHPGVSQVLQDYSKTFCNVMLAARPTLSDLRCNMKFSEDSIICALPQESRIKVSKPALAAVYYAAGNDPDRIRSAQELEAEVTSGGCWLSHDAESRRVLRVVQLVTLRLHHWQGGKVCARIAEWSGTEQRMVRRRLQLPGKKMRPGELPHQTLRRLLQSDFQGVDYQIEEAVDENSQIHPGSYKLFTKYVTTEFSACMQANCDMRQVGSLPAPDNSIDSWQTNGVPIFINDAGAGLKVSVYTWVPEEALQAAPSSSDLEGSVVEAEFSAPRCEWKTEKSEDLIQM